MTTFLKPLVITTIACLWASSGRSAAQNTWHVDHRGGPGIHFTGLEPAYLAAAPNDRILVHYGDGDNYRLPGFQSKPVRVLGQVSPTGLRPIVITAVTEIQVAQNEMIVLHGLELRVDSSAFSPRFYDRSSRGVILLFDLDMPACCTGGCWFGGSGRVILANVRAEGWSCRISMLGSVHAWLQSTDISEVSAWGSVYGPLWASENARLRVIGGRYIGGHGSSDCPFPGPPGFSAAPGIYLGSFAAHRVLGPATAIGGLGNYYHPVCGWGSGTGGTRGGRAVGISNCSWLESIDPLVRLISDTTLNLCPNIPVRELPAVLPGSLRPGQPHLVDVYGTTNSSVSLFVSFLSPAAPIRLPFGEVWLDPSLSLPVRSFPVGTQRHVSIPVNYPPASVHVGDVLVYQAVTMSSGRVLQLSEPGFCVVQ